MKSIIKLTLFSLILSLISASSYAERIMSGAININKKPDNVRVITNKIEGQIGSFDKVFLTIDGKEKEILDSEGREVKDIYPVDIDLDGKNEYLITMDCGGSGGFFDLTIQKEKDGKWVSIWEDTLSQPKIEINNNRDKVYIKIEHLEKITYITKKVVSTLNYENGKVIKH